ncbi:MAG: carbamoyltransferase HypF [Polaromonas sp.]|nr:carbamoyltransferase HypF [Polaromonas sp.]
MNRPADSARPPPVRPVLAVGAWLKNTACLLEANGWQSSALHGDLRDADACRALEASARALATRASQPVAAIAHDLHPDFFSTRLALALADEWQIPAIAVQHHHAHIAAVMAEHGLRELVIGLALDGVGLGSDGTVWGGELLRVAPGDWKRLGHLWPLALPGGDAAARQPWRMLASALHAMGRGADIEPRLAPAVGTGPARMMARMLDAKLNCPSGTSAGRWFDAAAAALGLHLHDQTEAEAAIALEQQAARWLSANPPAHAPGPNAPGQHPPAVAISTDASALDIRPLMATLLAWPQTADSVGAAAAWFHLTLAHALADWAAHAARRAGCGIVCLGGGCFMNAILTREVTRRLNGHGLRVLWPENNSCGDAGLALGQAWVVGQQLDAQTSVHTPSLVKVDY